MVSMELLLATGASACNPPKATSAPAGRGAGSTRQTWALLQSIHSAQGHRIIPSSKQQQLGTEPPVEQK